MQDPDQTIPVPQGYNAPGQPQWPTPQPPNGQPQGQFPQQGNGWPPVPQAPYPQMPGQQPTPGTYNPGPGQFSGYPQSGAGQQFPQSPQNPRTPKKRGLLLAIIGVVVLLILGLGGFFVFTRNSAQKASNQNTTAQSSTTHVATAQAGQSSSGKNASASSSAQSGASSDNGAQAQATAAVSTALAQAQSQGNNVPSQAQALAQAGAPTEVAKSFFTAIQNQDYVTAYKYTSFKSFTNDSFHQASTASDQSLGKLASYTLGKTTLFPGSNTVNAQVAVVITRANVPSHSGLAMLTLENGTWKITDGTVWQ